MQKVKVKPLRWSARRADTLFGSYIVEVDPNKRWQPKSHTFCWYPDASSASERGAKALCQRHFNGLIMQYLEVEDDA